MKTLIKYSITAAAFCLACGAGRAAAQQQGKAPKQYDVAAYVYPAYASDDPRLRPFWPMGIGEWETVMTMQQRNPGHYWDRKPLWGYVNEADPAVMSMEIEQATRHGVNVFIFDWYWYDGRPFMETTLDNGFLKAGNVDKMRFYLMWANHDVLNHWDTRLARVHEQNVIWTGKVDREEFEKICRRNIEKYFKHPQYYKIDGKPVYEIMGEMCESWGSKQIGAYGYSAVGAVVGATYPEQLAELRQKLPHTMFLVPGYGAQGGGAQGVAGAFDKNGRGAIVNSSRAIMCAWKKEGNCPETAFAEAARREAIRMRDDITAYL